MPISNTQYIPLIRVEQVLPFVEYIENYQRQLVPALYELGVPEAIKNHTNDGYIAREIVVKLFELIQIRLDEEEVNTLISHATSITVARLVANKEMTGNLLKVLKSFIDLVKIDSTDTHFALEKEGEQYWFHRIRETYDPWLGGLVTLLTMVKLIQRLTMSKWVPNVVTSVYHQGEPLAAFFSEEVNYLYKQEHTGFYIPQNLMESPVVTLGKGKPLLNIEDLLTFRYSLKALLKPYLSTHLPTINEAADHANMSKRTLQRRLNAEGVSFGGILNELIDEEACECLISTNEKISTIGLNLGYSSGSHFTRAFKKKFQVTPSQFRAKYQRLN